MAKKEEILELLNAYKSEVDNFNDAIFTDKFEVLADDIVKLFAIHVVVQAKPEKVCEHIFKKSYGRSGGEKCIKCGKRI